MKLLEGGEPVRACMRWVLFSIGAMLALTAGCFLAVAKLPLTIITALLQGPASVLSMKVTNVQDAASLATQQKALLDAQNALFKDIVASRAQALPVTGSGAGTGP